ncbi:roadblock/LC7 domain-containing protein [Streptomyces sp. NPDC048639]|uniref:roadblock/LC7 domain-containing protein n=1 Tax=Streptomyces sp. NPDC048639 TaxID=3365581 RepID=UPI0037177D23
MTTPGTDLSGLGWILDENILRLPHTLRAVLLSADGLTAASSEGVERDMADRMAAAVSGMQSLSREAAEFADCQESPWELTMIQYTDGFIFTMAAGPGTFLAVATTADADVEAVSYAMEKAIDRLGHEMSLPARDSAGSSA